MEKKIPVLFTENFLCSGCGACFSICARDAIAMKEDEEGFEYPEIDIDKCVYCLLCKTVCPISKGH